MLVDELLRMCLIVCPLIFLGGFVDSVAGGGGLITLPAYMMAGVPVHFAAGTNKVVNGIGTAAATVKYFRSGKIRLSVALPAAVGALVGGYLGAEIAKLLSDSLRKSCSPHDTIRNICSDLYCTFHQLFFGKP